MNSSSLSFHKSNRIKTYEVLTLVMIVLGLFPQSDVAKLSKYILSLLLQVGLILHVRYHKKKAVAKYFTVIFLVFVIVVHFFVNNVQTSLIINRALPLISLFGVVLIGEYSDLIDIGKVLKRFCRIYVLVMIVTLVDYAIYIVTGTAFLWEPYIYFGARITGPLGDPNFVGLFSVSVMLMIWNMDYDQRYKKFASVILLSVILLSLSISVWLVAVGSLVLHKRFPKNNRSKAILIFGANLLFMVFFSLFREDIMTIGTKIMTLFYGGDEFAGGVKFGSAMIRFDTQAKALKLFSENWIGQGPHQMVAQLGHDTHNSYISFLFEGGLPELLLIFVTLNKKVSNSFNSMLGTFLMLMALVLNVHDTAIWTVFLLSQYYNCSNTVSEVSTVGVAEKVSAADVVGTIEEQKILSTEL